MKYPIFSRSLSARVALAAGLALLSLSSQADTVKMKDGKVYDGKITFEGTDFIKLEIPVSATIKDTKTLVRTDILEIIKAAPDDVALDALRKQLPAPSLMTPEGYRTMIDKGPKAFLTQFPSSRHKAEVEKIMADLTSELDKVERGGVKLEGEWVSAQDRKQFEALTNSRIRLVVMRRNLAQRNFIAALRDFEVLEEQFYGTPAFAMSVAEIQQALPAFGGLIQQSLNSVTARNEQWEKDKGVLDEVARAQVEGARAQELANFTRATTQEKAAGVKWLTINNNLPESLNGAITLIKSEITRLAAMDVAALTQMGEQLVAADKLIAEGKLAEAREAITKATGSAPKSSGSSKSGSSKSSSKGKAPKTSYVAALTTKISEAEQAIKLAVEQAKDAAEGAKAASAVKGSEAPLVTSANPGEAAPVPAEGDPAAADQASALTGLLATGAKSDAAGEKGKAEEPAKKSSAKKSSSKKASTSDDEDEDLDEDKPKREAPVDDEEDGGGFSVQRIIQIGAAILVLALVVMKVMGVGKKKD
jgi:hypothetical protein